MAAGATFSLIQTASPTSGTSYIFSSIPSTYTDLVLIGSIRMSGNTTVRLRINGISSGYNYKHYTSDASVSTSSSASQVDLVDNNGSIISNFHCNIQNYSASTLASKSFICNSADHLSGWFIGGDLPNSSIITSLTLLTINGQTFASGTKLSLYGIARA